MHHLVNFPPLIHRRVSHQTYVGAYGELRNLAEKEKAQMEAENAAKELMEAENEGLRQELYAKKKPNGAKREKSKQGAVSCTNCLKVLTEDTAQSTRPARLRPALEHLLANQKLQPPLIVVGVGCIDSAFSSSFWRRHNQHTGKG
ncbi:hypothetical protein BV22DRAFT_1133534 [Leucogyrophana mollusca]|uniref:Uncharacterized protein n=1 Tax=Leucogyrophana mollusca TaxID=85980 RepID=A0ACB8B207_9AGAM|nr:hypothetical protein BV22DRAFT_1133534 [Leucogyrophana mollusca]